MYYMVIIPRIIDHHNLKATQVSTNGVVLDEGFYCIFTNIYKYTNV